MIIFLFKFKSKFGSPNKPNLHDTFLIARSDNQHYTMYSNSFFFSNLFMPIIRCNIKGVISKKETAFLKLQTHNYGFFLNFNHVDDYLVT